MLLTKKAQNLPILKAYFIESCIWKITYFNFNNKQL